MNESNWIDVHNQIINDTLLFGNTSTITTTPFDYNYVAFEEENTMSLFNWFLVEKFVEGKEPTKSGFITAKDEESAREFIIRTLDAETFEAYKNEEYVLVVLETCNWEI